jgi:hypothetical protein
MSIKKLRRIIRVTTKIMWSAFALTTSMRRCCFTIAATLIIPMHALCQVNLNSTPETDVKAPSTSQSGEGIVGTVRVQNGRVVNLVTAAKIYRIEGLIVPYLLKEEGKQWRLEGRLVDELTLEAVYAVPLQPRKS